MVSPPAVLQSVQASDQNRPLLLEFFRRLPVVLRRDDVQVVHAAMDEDALALLPHAAELDTLTASFARRIEADLQATGQWDQAEAEKAEFAGLRQHAVEPTRHLAAVGEVGSRKQAGNPVKLLTSGPELPVAPTKHFFAGGKWRFVYRDPWWSRWQGRPTVVGHYWRRRAPLTQSLLLADFGHDRWCNKVFCIDYSVGVRFDERSLGKTAAFSHALAALRWPERVLQFDDTASPVPTLGF